tara:strand:- start:15405 stop:16595 length:1191 start_codon:yes stop_codon:yes gene_type:complete
MPRPSLPERLSQLLQQQRHKLAKRAAVLRHEGSRVLTNANDRFLRTRELTLSGQTPYEVLHDNGLVKLRHYLPLTETEIQLGEGILAVNPKRHRVPVVLVPPLAVNMNIYDFFPERSLVKFLLAHGFSVYLIDWGRPTLRHTHYNLETYIADFMPDYLSHIRRHAGVEELSLHGWSIGGVLALGYAALSKDPNIRNLVIVGTPINGHASGALGKMYQRLAKQAAWVRKHTGFRVHNLSPRLLHTPGWINSLSFKMLSPANSLLGYWELITRLDDREFVVNHATNGAFLDDMVAYPGGVIQDMMIRIWLDNDLADGRIHLGKHQIDFADIKASLLAFAGKQDTMVTADAMRPLPDLISSDDATLALISGGHMGILAGSNTPTEAWPQLADWLAPRSQ